MISSIFWPNKNPMDSKLAKEAVIKRIPDGSATPCIVRLLTRKHARSDIYLALICNFYQSVILPRIIILKEKEKLTKTVIVRENVPITLIRNHI